MRPAETEETEHHLNLDARGKTDSTTIRRTTREGGSLLIPARHSPPRRWARRFSLRPCLEWTAGYLSVGRSMRYARRDDWAPSAVTAAPPRVFLASHTRPSPHSRLGVARAVFAHDSPTIRLRAQPRDENDAAGDDTADEDDDLSEWLTLVSWCSLAAFLGCGIASAVYFVQSRETTRPAKVRAYNAEAAAWRDELAAAYASKWTPPAGASPPRLRVVRGADADAGAPAADEAMTLELVGPAARGKVLVIEGHGDLTGRHPPMRGDHGTDYARLERGAALVTVVENFHAVERRTEIAERARVQVGDDASGFEVSVPAMRCEAAPSQYGHSAVSVFLRTITLVEISPANEAYAGLEAVEGGYACALEYTEPSKEVPREDTEEERQSDGGGPVAGRPASGAGGAHRV